MIPLTHHQFRNRAFRLTILSFTMLFPCVISLALVIGVTLGSPSGYSGSGHLQHISVPDYNPMLEYLGQHVDLKEIPTKVIRITKTVAIKVPVPYPVKVPHHVPYPVHVDKPYPVPVTKIVKVPEPVNIPSPISHGGSIGGLGLSHGEQDAALYQEPSQSYGGSDYSGGYGHASSGPQGYGDFGGHGDTEASINQGYSNAVQGYGGHEQYGESQQVASHIAHYVPNQAEAYNGRESVMQYQQVGAPAGAHYQDNSHQLQGAHSSS